MERSILNTKTFDEWRESMDREPDGSYKNFAEFEAKSDLPCYIAEYATEIDDIMSYQDMLAEATEWLDTEVREMLAENLEWFDVTPEAIVDGFWSSTASEWCFFSTYLNDLLT